MFDGVVLEFGVKDFRHEEHQVLRDEAEPAAVCRTILDIEMPEGFLAKDSQIGEAEHLLERWEVDLVQVAVIDCRVRFD